jgi:hypothetical protein
MHAAVILLEDDVLSPPSAVACRFPLPYMQNSNTNFPLNNLACTSVFISYLTTLNYSIGLSSLNCIETCRDSNITSFSSLFLTHKVAAHLPSIPIDITYFIPF